MTPGEDRQGAVGSAGSRLPTFDMNQAAAERIRGRCHRVLAPGGRWRRLAVFAEAPLYRRVLEPALVAVVSGVYLLEVVSRAVRLLL